MLLKEDCSVGVCETGPLVWDLLESQGKSYALGEILAIYTSNK